MEHKRRFAIMVFGHEVLGRGYYRAGMVGQMGPRLVVFPTPLSLVASSIESVLKWHNMIATEGSSVIDHLASLCLTGRRALRTFIDSWLTGNDFSKISLLPRFHLL